ncbi:unnamed protein product [Cyclocybe aegerita]|uniref:2,4-dienoyl-CoA reductase [(3E)-enoyl-CoA-producing] n=1 Tax=Cyclocybe aegerita TaxID=1973307 RepID=A0A8S0VZH7_CYCAE|nr:unnamed protein product [Cyclocybe aegerita]
MAPALHIIPIVDSTAIFKDDIFKGKVLFCTGGGSGICRGMTEAMMRHGANAVILGRKFNHLTQTAKELSQATGRECLPVQVDVREPATLKEAVAKTITKFRRINYVICVLGTDITLWMHLRKCCWKLPRAHPTANTASEVFKSGELPRMLDASGWGVAHPWTPDHPLLLGRAGDDRFSDGKGLGGV